MLFRYILKLLHPRRFSQHSSRHRKVSSHEIELQSHDSDGHYPYGTPY
jgi:hypothetical protein